MVGEYDGTRPLEEIVSEAQLLDAEAVGRPRAGPQGGGPALAKNFVKGLSRPRRFRIELAQW